MTDTLPPPVILILEDDANRISGFAQAYHNTPFTIFITDQVDQCIEILQKHPVQLAYLDHDLGGKVFVDSDKEPTGLHVAEWIARNPDRAPRMCFIHSLNPSGARAMSNAFRNNPKITTIIAPYPSCLIQYKISPQ